MGTYNRPPPPPCTLHPTPYIPHHTLERPRGTLPPPQVNKAPGMVVHPSVGHAGGTLVNAVLHHCALPAMRVTSGAPPSATVSHHQPLSASQPPSATVSCPPPLDLRPSQRLAALALSSKP